MINRVLIRIKVVQILYSYLLVEKQFSFESSPSNPTKEKRFAYSLYLDMLVLMQRIAHNIVKRGGYEPLADTRFIKRIDSDEQLRSLTARYRIHDFPFNNLVSALSDTIKESGVYKNFLKERDANGYDSQEDIWRHIFDLFIIDNPQVNAIISTRENYSLRGVDRMRDMMAATFTNFMQSQDNIGDALASLRKSLDRARELYFRLLLLPVELTHLENQILDENRHKYLITEQDLNPDMKFVENAFAVELGNNEAFNEYVDTNKLSWLVEDRPMLESLLRSIKESQIYADYMADPVSTLKGDCEFWREIYKKVIFCNPTFLEALEDRSVFWNDDIDIMGTFVLKTVRRIEEGDNAGAILHKFKDDEDAVFGPELIRAVLANKDTYRGYIDNVLHNNSWDRDRLAFMDVVILETAIAEILNFAKIPLSVSINEYIEIAKSYSTPKSGSFVNGILGGVVNNLRQEGKLLK